MATISFSTELVKEIMTSLTDLTYPPEKAGNSPSILNETVLNSTVTWSNSESGGSLFSNISNGGFFSNNNYYVNNASGIVSFRNSSGTVLTSYLNSELTRTIDSDGYCVLSNFPPKIPAVAPA